MKKREINVMANIKLIEILKTQILSSIAKLFALLTKGTNVAYEAILECISGAIILLYILGEKLGYSFSEVDKNIDEQLKLGIKSEDELEKDSKALSRLKEHIINKSN